MSLASPSTSKTINQRFCDAVHKAEDLKDEAEDRQQAVRDLAEEYIIPRTNAELRRINRAASQLAEQLQKISNEVVQMWNEQWDIWPEWDDSDKEWHANMWEDLLHRSDELLCRFDNDLVRLERYFKGDSLTDRVGEIKLLQ